MLTHADNELLSRVGPGTPMGALLREYWMPALRSAALEADGAPVRVRLMGENFVAFRSTDGRVGFFDEGCPHRCTSLALARNEDNALTCIFHGWKIDVSGKVVEVPSEPPERRAEFAAKVRVRHYPVREAGTMVWVYLGARSQPPRFYDFEFNLLPDSQVVTLPAVMHANWFQGLEAVLDSAHLGILHSGHMRQAGAFSNNVSMSSISSPTFEFMFKPYGFREGALRALPDGQIYARIREYVAPFFSFIPYPPDRPGSIFISVPLDDEWTKQWMLYWYNDRDFTADERQWFLDGGSGDPDNFSATLGSVDNLWHQDRAWMKEGHWTGIKSIPYEDFVVEESMGAIVDRSREYLGSSDTVIIRARRMMLEAARAYQQGQPPPWLDESIDFRKVRALAIKYPGNLDWRGIDTLNPPRP
jgi:phthalate 4,5-dioxygenase oxygenase subunit